MHKQDEYSKIGVEIKAFSMYSSMLKKRLYYEQTPDKKMPIYLIEFEMGVTNTLKAEAIEKYENMLLEDCKEITEE